MVTKNFINIKFKIKNYIKTILKNITLINK